MKKNSPKTQLPDHDAGLENDAVWNLLDHGSTSGPSPAFVQNTLRRARLESVDLPWWKKLSARRIWALSLTSAGSIAAAVALIVSLQHNPAPAPQVVVKPDPAPAPLTELENALASELLTDAAEDPSLLSDQEIVALLY